MWWQAADAFDRAARAPYGRIPAASPAGTGPRRAARLIAAYTATGDRGRWPLVPVARLAALAEAVAAISWCARAQGW